MTKRILVLPLYGIGDVLMTTPALRNIKELMDAEITCLHMFKTTRDILLNNPHVDAHYHFPFLEEGKLSGLRFLSQFRKRFDCTINFYPSNRRDYSLAAFFVGSPVRIGHRYVSSDLAEMNFLKNRTVKEDDGLHNVEENLRLLDFLGVDKEKAKTYPLRAYVGEEERLIASKWLGDRTLRDRNLIGIHAGASVFKNHGRKRWAEGSFSGLIDRLAESLGEGAFLLFGGPEEKSIWESVRSKVHHKDRVFFVDSVSIREAAAIMEKCALFISNDSGPMHMAAALGRPTVAIFGPTNPKWVGPWGVKRRIVRLNLPCSPCFRYSPKPLECISRRGYECLREIHVDSVYDACVDLMKECGFFPFH